ncbi:kinase-like protein [Rhizophagus irregularis]|uniref:Kinase-like protein n=1 Tax=Rhizophagus irregularis TaxID=588596 RepID=A0A2I1GYG7_9GLOM|nr:kinase-like protein [Rhizophagus irregularis]
MQAVSHSNEDVNWFEDAISKGLIKRFEYEDFSEMKQIGNGSYGKVYCAIWTNSAVRALKSFNLNITENIKKIVNEFKIHYDVNYHDNIIRLFGTVVQENGNYLLVMEYADNGTLRSYLEKNKNLTWEFKFKLAYQLSSAVSYLHDEGIMHLDLHSKNILIHQNSIKLADFGLSRRVNDVSEAHSGIYGVLAYIDPQKLDDNMYRLNKKSDIYSIGVLLWEISSGRPPFEKVNQILLPANIIEGVREKIIPDTPEVYKNIITECWDCDPDNRPEIKQVADRLDVLYRPNIIIPEAVQPDTNYVQSSDEQQSSARSQLIDHQNINIKVESNTNVNLFEKATEEIYSIINENLKNEKPIKNNIFDYQNNPNITSQEIYNWLNDQNEPHFIFLRGCYNYYGIKTDDVYEMAFKLFEEASKQNHMLAQYYVGLCYHYGHGVIKKDKKLALEYFKKTADENFSSGQLRVGSYYRKKKDFNMAFHWYEKAANSGNNIAQFHLACMYKDGEGVAKDYNKAFQLFQKSAEGEHINGIAMLGYCYRNGIGTCSNKKKAIVFYQKAANLGHNRAQYILALMYESGEGVEKDYEEAFELCKKSAEGKYLEGMFTLAYYYCDGIGTNVDEQKAAEIYQEAAEKGHSKAQYNLALMYENGEGIDRDYKKAFKLYKKSSREVVEGVFKLGYFYKNGLGISVNKQKAVKFYQKAANLGHFAAKYNLALMYETGEGVSKDYKKAIELFKDAFQPFISFILFELLHQRAN